MSGSRGSRGQMGGRGRAVACCAVAAAVAAVVAAGAGAEARAFVAGGYAGASAQGKKVTFGLSSDGTTIRSFKASLVATCAKHERSRAVNLATLHVGAGGVFSAAS